MKLACTYLLLVLPLAAFVQNATNAIEKCDVAKFQKYLDKGGDINVRIELYDEYIFESYESTLMDYAVAWNCMEIIKLLVSQKEKIEDYDLIMTEAFIYSLAFDNEDITEFLYEQHPIEKGICDVCHGNNVLMVAANYGRENWYFKMKEQSDLQYINHTGSNLIHSAASGPSQKILLDVLSIDGLDINKTNSEGLTPLDYAASNEKNPEAFNTLIDHGADPNQAWNLLYWWSMIPSAPLTPEIINDRRDDVWMIDEDGENCLMLISYFVEDIDFMMEDIGDGKGDLSFVPQFYQDGITMNILNAMLYIEDFNSENPIYKKYLSLLGALCEKAEFCPVYKKEYKTAVKIYGEEKVSEWYEEYNLPVE